MIHEVFVVTRSSDNGTDILEAFDTERAAQDACAAYKKISDEDSDEDFDYEEVILCHGAFHK